MNMKKVKIIKELLDHYFPEPAIPLLHKDPYTLLIAVLLSAQCTDERVNRITPQLFALADTPEKMLHLSYTQIQDIIRPCGLSKRKAWAIFDLSKMLLEQFEGKVPHTFGELESLPGIGHKSASVIMAQVFHKHAFPVDTHIFRLARRWGLSKGKTVTAVERDLKKAFDKNDWIRLHLQIIYYARKFCPAKGHKIECCPICQALSCFNSQSGISGADY